MNKNKSKLWIVIFTICLCVPFVIRLFTGPIYDSENQENRQAASNPSGQVITKDGINWQALESFPNDYESYYNDTMLLRSPLIRFNNTLDYSLFHSSNNPEVVIGKDGWLFYKGNEVNENPLGQSLGQDLLTDQQLEDAALYVWRIQKKLELLGMDFVLFVAPNKETIYSADS